MSSWHIVILSAAKDQPQCHPEHSEGSHEILRAKALRMTQLTCHPERSEGSHEILRAKALRMTQLTCHPERSEGSHEILRAKALRMTQLTVILSAAKDLIAQKFK